MKLTPEEIQRTAAKVWMAREAKGSDALKIYGGKEYFVDAWEGPGTTHEEAVAAVQEPLTLGLILMIHGLEYILADRHATSGLKQRLIEKNPLVRMALAEYATFGKPKGKPGPRPKDGGYLGEMILGLDEQGLSNGEIAKQIYGDPKKRALVAAHLAQVRKKHKKVLAGR